MKTIRKRLTYANVMSSIAVFLVIGGATAFAALGKNTVGSKQLKKNAVTTAKIKNGAVTGSKVNVSAFPKVPSAVTADSATNAGHASSADKANTATTADKATTAGSAGTASNVNGNSIQKISFRTTSNSGVVGPTPVLNAGGLLIEVTCTSGQATVTASTSKQDSSIYVDVFQSFATSEFFQAIQESGEFDIGDNVDMLAGQGGNNDMSLFEYDAVDGTVVTGQIVTDEDGALQGCRVNGHATVS